MQPVEGDNEFVFCIEGHEYLVSLAECPSCTAIAEGEKERDPKYANPLYAKLEHEMYRRSGTLDESETRMRFQAWEVRDIATILRSASRRVDFDRRAQIRMWADRMLDPKAGNPRQRIKREGVRGAGKRKLKFTCGHCSEYHPAMRWGSFSAIGEHDFCGLLTGRPINKRVKDGARYRLDRTLVPATEYPDTCRQCEGITKGTRPG